MDKYTVDLDKVLNDFEYSELTDNFGTARGYVPQSGSNYASSSKSKTGEAKHSITNVFHSLNEYLNTDISTPKVNVDNNTENIVKTQPEFPVSALTTFSDDKNKFTSNLLDIEDVVLVPEDLHLDLNNTDNNSETQKPRYVEKPEEKLGQPIELYKYEYGKPMINPDGIRLIEGMQVLSVKIADDSKPRRPLIYRVDKNGDAVYVDADSDTNLPAEGNLDANLREITVQNDATQQELEEGIVEIVKTESEVKTAETMKGAIEDTTETIEKLTETVEKTTEAIEKPETIGKTERIDKTERVDKTERIDKIEQIDKTERIDETEIIDKTETINKIEASDERERIINTETIEKTTETTEKLTDVKEIIKSSTEEEEETIGTTAKLNNQVIEKTENLEDNLKSNVVTFNDTFDIDDSTLNQYLDDLELELGVQGVGDTKDDQKSVKEDEETSKEDTENSKEDEENLKEDEKNSKEDEKSSEENESVLTESETVDIPVDKSKVDVADEEVVEDSEDSLSRPKMLDLPTGASGSIDEAKREINLIGEPGSTPYNNIYVSKELQSENKPGDPQENPSENSSVSPTFSEASTETVSDSSESDSEDNQEIPADVSNVKPVRVEENACAGAEAGDNATSENPTVENADLDEGNAETPTNEIANAEAEVAYWLGKQAPIWIPDSDALSCLHCDTKFTVIKRRHHCRACGLVLCSKCCGLKYRLEYLDAEARVCSKCHAILNRDTNSSSGSEISPYPGNSPFRQPNPNNPMEYCSVVPPMQQVANVGQNPPTVMVPVGVLKRKGSNKGKSNKSVMFCDGIRPGSDLAKLDTDFNYVGKPPPANPSAVEEERRVTPKPKYDTPAIDPETKSFLPKNGQDLPPLVTVFKSETTYICGKYSNNEKLVDALKKEKLTFALYKNIYVHVKIVDMSCCINKKAWCFTTEGFLSVGQDELVYLIEYIEDEGMLPMDVFHHLNLIYKDALKGTSVTELGLTLHNTSTFLDFKNHAGFLYIRPTFQCLQNIVKPTEPFLIGLLIHRWETPWAKIFPLRLVLRLGAEYRYYPSPIISTRHRDSVFVEIGHTIINLLADFRNFSYTLPSIRGLTIHMEEKNTTVTIPRNRYDQVIKSINNSSDHILAFGGNFSMQADSHLVCIQDTQSASENSYTTHAINIQNRPRKVTGASFIVFNGALKSTSGLTAKSSIVEDGLMIQIPAEEMVHLREHMRNMKTYTIQCGCINAPSDETVNIIWGEADNNFNLGVTSPIDNQSLSGVPSIRVHNGKDFVCNSGNKLIRWTEVFIIQNTDHESKTRDPVDISKISENISKATCQALVKYLDLLSTNNFSKISLRTTLNVENVSYLAGSNNVKLPPIYMKSLDNELIPVLHRITSNNLNDVALTLELVFRILNT